jgi:hypothetical protein
VRKLEDLPYLEWQPEASGTQRLYADLWERDELNADAAITSFAVEDGSLVSDHYVPDPIMFKATLFFSGSPVRGDLDKNHPGAVDTVSLDIPEYPQEFSIRGGLQALGILPGPTVPDTVQALTFASPPGRLREVLNQLLELRAARTLLTVGSSTIRLESMALKHIGLGRTPEDGDSGSIELEFQQVTFTSSDTAVALPLPAQPRAQAPKAANAGGDKPIPEGPQNSALKALKDKLFGSNS